MTKTAARAASRAKKGGPPFTRLGAVSLKVVGLQYYDAAAPPGERVHFEREPRNPYDANAIRVENEDFAQIGHVSRREARWLAPLIDEGLLHIEGWIPGDAAVEKQSTAAETVLYLAKGKRAILGPPETVDSAALALHDVVIHAWSRAAEWPDPATIRAMCAKLAPLVDRDALPETHLALRLLEVRARDAEERRRQRGLQELREALRRVRVGGAVSWRNVHLLPLYGPGNGKSAFTPLDEALKRGKARVREVSHAGAVNELVIENPGKRPLAAFRGLVVAGGKQDRMIMATTVVWPETAATVVAGCVERGRWAYDGRAFQARSHAPPCMRRGCAPLGPDGVDQEGLWGSVDACLASTGVESPTATLTAGFESAASANKNWATHLKLDKDAAGAVVCVGGEIAGIELFDAAATFRKVWPRLRAGYALEALHAGNGAVRGAKPRVQRVLKGLGAAAELVEEPQEKGRRFAFDCEGLAGEAFMAQETLLHLALHPLPMPPSAG